MEKQTGARNEDLATAATAWTLFWGLNRRPTTVGDDSADTFPAGAETAACCAGGRIWAWRPWALCLLEGAHRSFHADGAALMSLREVFFEVPRRGRCCVVICFFHTMPASADPLLIRPVVPGWLMHWQRALKLWSGIRSHRKEGDNHAVIQ